MKLLDLLAAEQAPGTALDLPTTWDPPVALPGHSSSALSHGRDWNPVPIVFSTIQLACSPSDVSVETAWPHLSFLTAMGRNTSETPSLEAEKRAQPDAALPLYCCLRLSSHRVGC